MLLAWMDLGPACDRTPGMLLHAISKAFLTSAVRCAERSDQMSQTGDFAGYLSLSLPKFAAGNQQNQEFWGQPRERQRMIYMGFIPFGNEAIELYVRWYVTTNTHF